MRFLLSTNVTNLIFRNKLMYPEEADIQQGDLWLMKVSNFTFLSALLAFSSFRLFLWWIWVKCAKKKKSTGKNLS